MPTSRVSRHLAFVVVLMTIMLVSTFGMIAATIASNSAGGSPERTIVDAESLIPISVLIASIITTASVTAWFAGLSSRIKRNESELARLRQHRANDFTWRQEVDKKLDRIMHHLAIDE